MLDKILRFGWRIISRIALFCFNLILKPFGKKLSEEQEKQLLQFGKFGVIGISNTIVSYLLNIGTIFILGKLDIWQDIDIYIGNGVAFFLSVLWSYFWNSRYVFKEDPNEKRVWWKTILKTYAAYALTGIGLSNLTSYIFVKVLGWSKYIAPIVNIVIGVPINYIINKFWAYGEKLKKKDEPESTEINEVSKEIEA